MPIKKRTKPVKVEEEVNSSQQSFNILKKPKIIIPLIIIVVGIVLFYLKGLFIVAIVNGQPISRIAVISQLEKQSGKQAVSSLITQVLILQEAKKKNIDVSKQEVDDMANKLAADLKKQGQDLDKALSLQGMTRKDLGGQLKIKKMVEKIFDKDIKVTDKEISDFVDKNKASIPQGMKGEELKASAKEQLMQQKLSTKVQSWLADLQKKAKIQYFVNY